MDKIRTKIEAEAEFAKDQADDAIKAARLSLAQVPVSIIDIDHARSELDAAHVWLTRAFAIEYALGVALEVEYNEGRAADDAND
jgi:hypothetical protein